MQSGIFQSDIEFDKYDGEVRRNYLAIDENGNVLLANMPDSEKPNNDAIRQSHNCLSAATQFSGTEITMQFGRNDVTVTLALRLDESGMHVVDSQQDEFGGWGGTYQRVAE